VGNIDSCSAAVRHAGNVTIIELSGRITLGDGAGVVRDAIRGAVDHGHKNILLDLRGVLTIDSAGLGEISGGYITVARVGGALKLMHAQSKVASLLLVTRLYTVLATFSDESEALESFR
jgi:anti-sigma B factor antagonist